MTLKIWQLGRRNFGWSEDDDKPRASIERTLGSVIQEDLKSVSKHTSSVGLVTTPEVGLCWVVFGHDKVVPKLYDYKVTVGLHLFLSDSLLRCLDSRPVSIQMRVRGESLVLYN